MIGSVYVSGYFAVGANQISWYENNDALTPQNNDTDGLIIKYDLDGNILWENDLNLNYYDNYNNILLLADGLALSVIFKEAPKSLEDVKNPETLDMFRPMLVSLISAIIIYFVHLLDLELESLINNI